MSVKGKVWKYGDDVNTDVIFPGKYTYTIKERSEMAKVACEDLDPEFTKNAKAGDIIVGGKNWGCGSSREQAVSCLKERGIAAIIAKSFARIYYRNCFNEGLPIIICPTRWTLYRPETKSKLTSSAASSLRTARNTPSRPILNSYRGSSTTADSSRTSRRNSA